MAEYSIYVLDESAMTIDGAQLDGVTQGDGSHMVGATITLNSDAWQPVLIRDDDQNFQDSDASQVLDGAQTIDGQLYGDGTRVEAEYSMVVTDGIQTYTVIAFNVNNSSPAYGTVEGLAFIGPPGSFPPVGTELTVLSASEGPSYAASSYVAPICFSAGTLIDTDRGPRPIEKLRPGDKVRTRGNGMRPVRWINRRRFAARGAAAPVRFAPGSVGNSRPLVVSQQHRLLIADWRAELWFGQPEVLVAAKALVDGGAVRLIEGGTVDYVHLLFDRHEVIFAEGAPAESLHPGQVCLDGLDGPARRELLSFFPELREGPMAYGPTAAPVLRRYEAQMLRAA